MSSFQMRLQLLSDLHLETEVFQPEPAPGAELLVLAGDIDSGWGGLGLFRDWPVPVLLVAGNHEFDQRELTQAWPALRERCSTLGIRLLECESTVLGDAEGRRIRFVGTTRWCDFDLFGPARRERAMRAGSYFVKVMRSTRNGAPFDALAVRDEALASRDWLRNELMRTGDWDATVAITHFAPSALSADPRYGLQPGTASFCNPDDDLLPFTDLWLHGHLHCQQDYTVTHGANRGGGSGGPGHVTTARTTRVVCNPRGHERKGEAAGHRPRLLLEV